MKDCELRKPGQDFCDECPHRAVLEECRREGVIPRSHLNPIPSLQTRIGVFVLSSLVMTIIPVVIRNVLRLRVEGDVSMVAATVLGIFGGIFSLITILAALYGLYMSVWIGTSKKRTIA